MSQNNQTNPKAGTSGPGGKQGYPLDNYTVQPKTGNSSDESPFYKSQAPSVSMPKGGGALKGIDEKFSVNAVNGTASLSVPLPLTPGRENFTPALSLTYNSGSGNSEFGLGWGLSLPAIQRKTDKKLPQYKDTEETDIFMLAGAEDLVPMLSNGNAVSFSSGAYHIRRYVPRIEGLFARIELIRKTSSNDTWWRVTTKDNITTWYGLTPEGRISDPSSAASTFKWLPQISIDSKGNVQEFFYTTENTDNVPQKAHERNRLNGTAVFTNRYLKKVSYCNKSACFIDESTAYEPAVPAGQQYLMEAVFDYGDHNGDIPAYAPDQSWPCRKDPFSDFHAGFEIRSWRKCRRVIMFHSFAELGDGSAYTPVPVQSLDLTYYHDTQTEALAEADFITGVLHTGYKKKPDGSGYYKKSLPPMTMEYQPLSWNTTINKVDSSDVSGAPQGLTGGYQWTDMYGEGISGILKETDAGWYYKRNLGNGNFSPALPVAQKPSFSGLGKIMQWQDLDADGRRQLVSYNPAMPGYFELDDDQQWQSFQAFPNTVNVDWNSPWTKMMDLDGDGRPDILITDESVWTWWNNKGTQGFTEGGRKSMGWDEEKGPRLLINDPIQSVFLADMNGDGLTDLVRIKNGEVCYWPNMGYGKFGAKVTMSDAPVFTTSDLYNPQFLHLADISGTGAPDLLYRNTEGVITAWVNLAGNGWSAPVKLGVLPSVENQSTITVMDFLGNGTGSLVWSSPLPQNSIAPMCYIDLMGGNKPYIMKGYKNGMGKRVALQYKSSAKYYLEDKAAGTPWATKLPFPVQCLSEVITADSVSDTSYSQSYSYHHGYYDHEEREFRGFGRVDTIDTDTAIFFEQHDERETVNNLSQFPVLTKTWFHTGAWMRESTLLEKYVSEFYPLNDYMPFYQLPGLTDIITLPANLSAQEMREAHRALKGSALRQEVYALDNTGKNDIPYTVSISGYKVQAYQPLAQNRYASFLTLQEQSISWSCERVPVDARIQHSITLSTDKFGNILENAQIAYPRHGIPADLPDIVKDTQGKIYITYGRHTFTNDVESTTSYRLRLPCDTATYEFHLSPGGYPNGLFTINSFKQKLPDYSNAVDYAAAVSANDTLLRRLSHTRTIFREDDGVTIAPFGILYALAIPDQQYTLAITNGIINASLDDNIQRTDLGMLSDAGYKHHGDITGFTDSMNDWWWLPSGTAQYTSTPATDFYQPASFTDPWGNMTTINYWPEYHLLPQSITDALGNASTVISYDWRCLQPTRMQDPNLNYSEMVYDALCMQVAMAVKGKDNGSTEADELLYLAGTDIIDPEGVADTGYQATFWTDPGLYAKKLLGRATWRCIYDLDVQPAAVAMIGREEHYVNNADSNVLIRITYTDGLGRIAMHKVQAADGPLPVLNNSQQSSPPGIYASPPEEDDNDLQTRWIGSGKTVYNNKGKAVMQFEPYFSDKHTYDPAMQASLCGVSPRIHYDALGRVYLTEMPDGTYSYTTWDNWTQTVFDANDTAMASSWYKARIGGAMGDNETDAAKKTEAHWHTPATMYLDTLARPCYTITMSDSSTEIHTAVHMDIAGDRLAIIDSTDSPNIHRIQLQYAYNMLRAPIWQSSIDGGTQRMLMDAAGQPCYIWDAGERRSHIVNDELRRPLRHELCLYNAGNSTWNTAQHLSVTIYGESATPVSGSIEDHNLRGQAVNIKDGSGMNWVDSFDFKGLPEQSFACLLNDGRIRDADWNLLNPAYDLSSEVFTTTVTADALSRPVSSTDPGGNVTVHTYNKDGALKTVVLNGDIYVQDIHHDAKGQREAIWYGNNTKTRYNYDPFNYRLTRLFSVNLSTNAPLQDLRYAYDATGNITRIEDKAQDAMFYNNSMMEPVMDYTYDALYRLIQASGREMINSNNTGSTDRYTDTDMLVNATPKWDGSALQHYTQYYRYDAVGNMLQLKHSADAGSYTRKFGYDSSNNYLRSVDVGGNSYDYYNGGNGYDRYGNMLLMPHLQTMEWDFSNQFCHSATGGNDTYYQYSSGQRVRKYTTKSGSAETRIYLGNFEIYRTFDSTSSLTLERTTVHISDDTGRIAMLEVKTYDRDNADTNATSLKRFIYSNHLGSAALELDENAAIISYEEYHPYGTTAYQAMNSDIKAVAKRYRFTGKERDEENGFYYHGARYYAPWLCRWTAVDPLESKYAPQSSYVYCSDNPIGRIDPDGKQDKKHSQDKKSTSVAYRYFYSTNGNFLGKEEIKDNTPADNKDKKKKKAVQDEVWTADSKSVVDGKDTYSNSKKLNLTFKEFQRYSGLVEGEDHSSKEVSFGIASAVMNLVKFNNGHGGKYTLHYLLFSNYSSNDSKNSTANTPEGIQARAAVINALNGGRDYSNGATHWDGYDLAALGNKHVKFREYGVELHQDHLEKFMNSWTDGEVKAYSGGTYTQKSKDFQAGTFKATEKASKYANNTGRVLFESTAVEGKTIFWKPNTNAVIVYPPKIRDKMGINPSIIVRPNEGYDWKYF